MIVHYGIKGHYKSFSTSYDSLILQEILHFSALVSLELLEQLHLLFVTHFSLTQTHEVLFFQLRIVVHKQFQLNVNYYSIINRKHMPPHDYHIAKGTEQSKRRPSIQLSPTLQKPIYIITKNMSGMHILSLIDELDKQKVQYQMQQQTQTLGFLLNQRFFVVVDNRYGEVTLGADFASVLMTIVGYPKKGKNKKNRYFQSPIEIVKYFKEWKNNNEISKLSRSYLKSNFDAVIMDDNDSQKSTKIEVKSISKYKSQDSKRLDNRLAKNNDNLGQERDKIKLIVLQDKNETDYNAVCQCLYNQQGLKQQLEKASTIDQVRKKTFFHTNKVRIFYLANKKMSKQLISSIFIGEVLIYNPQKQMIKVNQMADEPKIHAICYEKNQLLKILHKLGFSMTPSASILNSKIQPSILLNSKNTPLIDKHQSMIQQKQSIQVPSNTLNIEKPKPQYLPVQISRIDQQVSSVSEKPEESMAEDLNVSVISKTSSVKSKIKKLKPKSKVKNAQLSAFSPSKKREEPISLLQQTSQYYINTIERKRTLKTSQKVLALSKSKKNLTFKDDHVKRIKSIPKVQPEVFCIKEENQSTNTENEYYIQAKKDKKTSNSSANGFFSLSRNSLISTSKAHKGGMINGIFYRQFVPKFHNLAQIIKMKPQSLFLQNSSNSCIHSFVYIRQYDRFVRRLKNKLRQERYRFQEYNLIVLLRNEDFQPFKDYCQKKNQSYQEQNDFTSTIKQNEYSSLGKEAYKLYVYAFIDGCDDPEEKYSFGRIQLFKHKLYHDSNDYDLSRTIQDVRHKVLSHSNLISKN